MNGMARLRQRTRARTVLVALTLGWLTVALQPCVMAGPLSALLPDAARAHASADINPVGHGGHGDCPHCAMGAHGDCSGDADCEVIGAVQANGMTFKDTAPKLMAVAPEASSVWVAPRVACADWRHRPAQAPPHGRPLTVRYCVYLK